jgi:hypothetical protein
VAADQYQMAVPGVKFLGSLLGEGPAAGGKENGPPGAVGLHNMGPAAVQRIRLHNGSP